MWFFYVFMFWSKKNLVHIFNTNGVYLVAIIYAYYVYIQPFTNEWRAREIQNNIIFYAYKNKKI